MTSLSGSIPHLLLLRMLGLSLLHFVWEGALIAAFCAALFKTARSSAVRYAAGCLALLLMAAAPAINLEILALHRPAVASPLLALPVGSSTPQSARTTGGNGLPAGVTFSGSWIVSGSFGSASAAASSHTNGPAQLLAQLKGLISNLLPWMAVFWLAGAAFFLLRLLVGWSGVRRLVEHAAPIRSRELEAMLERLSLRIGVSRPVRLLQSATARVPGVVGWMPSVILIPVSALTQLSPAEIEAILAHELADVRRHDYLVNLMQTWIEALLFYHPAVWWVSGRIRVERENCCDDLVIASLNDRKTYARALANLATALPVRPALALHASDGQLLNRIRRILGLPADAPPPAPPAALIGAAVLLGVLGCAHLRAAGVHHKQSQDHGPKTPVSVGQIHGKRTLNETRTPEKPARSDSVSGDKASIGSPVYVSGQVLRKGDNAPLPGVIVSLYHGTDADPVCQTQTLQNGAYILKAPAGRYRLTISGRGIPPQQQIVQIGPVRSAAVRIVALAYNNEPRLAGYRGTADVTPLPVDPAGAGAALPDNAPAATEPDPRRAAGDYVPYSSAAARADRVETPQPIDLESKPGSQATIEMQPQNRWNAADPNNQFPNNPFPGQNHNFGQFTQGPEGPEPAAGYRVQPGSPNGKVPILGDMAVIGRLYRTTLPNNFSGYGVQVTGAPGQMAGAPDEAGDPGQAAADPNAPQMYQPGKDTTPPAQGLLGGPGALGTPADPTGRTLASGAPGVSPGPPSWSQSAPSTKLQRVWSGPAGGYSNRFGTIGQLLKTPAASGAVQPPPPADTPPATGSKTGSATNAPAAIPAPPSDNKPVATEKR